MSNGMETRLRETIRRHVEEINPPAPPTEQLLRAARRRRRARVSGRGLAGIVATGVAATLVGTLGSGGAPAYGLAPIVRDGAAGPAAVTGPRAVFLSQGTVHLDGRALHAAVPLDNSAHIARLGVLYADPTDHHPVLLHRDGTKVDLEGAPPAGIVYGDLVAADTDSDLVAWSEVDRAGKQTTVVAEDAGTGKRLGQITMPCTLRQPRPGEVQPPASGPVIFDGDTGVATDDQGNVLPPAKPSLECPQPYVADDGRVVIDGPDGHSPDGRTYSVWEPATSKVSDLPSLVEQAHGKVFTTFAGQVPGGSIGPGWEQVAGLSNVNGVEKFAGKPFEAQLSYDGGWLLGNAGQPRVVNWRNPSQSITYRPPRGVREAVFDTDGSVLVVTKGRSGRYTGWDCALGGRCQVVVPGQRQRLELVGWDT